MGCRAGAVLIRLLTVVGLVVVWPGAAAPGAYADSGGRAGERVAAGAADHGTTGRPDGSGRREKPEILFRFTDSRITESSGLAVSPTHKGIYYTHNDSDDGPRFFAVGPDGRTRATFWLANAAARDWEGMAASVDRKTGKGVLWFADIGDNFNGAWPDISIYKVIEPERIADATLRATRYRFRYADGGRNAEGIMVHPGTGRLYVVSKEFSGSIYQAPAKLRTDRVNILRRVGSAPIMATDAAYAPDGSSFVIRTYISASIYRAPDELIARVSMPALDQAESIAYTPDGRYLLTGSEGRNSPVYRVPLPEEVLARTAEPSPSPSPEPSAAKAEPTRPAGVSGTAAAAPGEGDDEGVPVGMILLWLAVAAGATGVIAVIARTAR
jgi:hypothetical protein